MRRRILRQLIKFFCSNILLKTRTSFCKNLSLQLSPPFFFSLSLPRSFSPHPRHMANPQLRSTTNLPPLSHLTVDLALLWQLSTNFRQPKKLPSRKQFNLVSPRRLLLLPSLPFNLACKASTDHLYQDSDHGEATNNRFAANKPITFGKTLGKRQKPFVPPLSSPYMMVSSINSHFTNFK